MAKATRSPPLILFLIITTTTTCFHFHPCCCSIFRNIRSRSRSRSSSSSSSVVLPLETKVIPSQSIPKPPNKLSFHHNVSLTVSLSVGTPPQNVSMVIDTGSELSWLNCKSSPSPSPSPSHPMNTFHPFLSSSYSPIPCSSPTCTTRTRDFSIPVSCDPSHHCHATLAYVDSSSSEGNLASTPSLSAPPPPPTPSSAAWTPPSPPPPPPTPPPTPTPPASWA
ncbi:hypothetical protein Sjap_001814 [Stephania japonica]|uniref:Peptidase A1 domain-containing protein n=1 Tax=Stephania japonica TaxID=461633 RepID=A0AAP0KMZ7_9MAGN